MAGTVDGGGGWRQVLRASLEVARAWGGGKGSVPFKPEVEAQSAGKQDPPGCLALQRSLARGELSAKL